jgi:putative hydrolase of the HAD superfamily
VDAAALLPAIARAADWYWSDPDRHRIGRLNLRVARAQVAQLALAELGIHDAALADSIGGAYHALRDETITIFPDAVDTMQWFRESGCKLALLTNGAAAPQRDKIERFKLYSYFDAIFIEGEVGFGKPDARVYSLALETLDADPGSAWMIGDNLEWDVAQPQRLGIFGVWVDREGKGHARLETVRPGRIIRTLSDLRVHAQRGPY